MKSFMFLSAVAPALLLSGCGNAAKCNANNCLGCCDSSGTCVVATSGLTCGAKGSACVTCNSGQWCGDGACAGGTAQMGGGTAGGGSASTGGGSTATGGGSAATGGGTGNALDDQFLAGHNAARARTDLKPVPNPALEPFTLSTHAKSVATTYAAKCIYAHDPELSTLTPPLGENIFASTGSPTVQGIVNSWMSEDVDYTYATNSCRLGEQCGHYTQIVWRSTTSVGCAIQECHSGSPFVSSSHWYLAVCDYAPPGNLVGSKPY